jgi:hypothetical protein
VFVADLSLEDDGPGDAPGSREVGVALRNAVPVTAEQWRAHRDGEWPWGPTGE